MCPYMGQNQIEHDSNERMCIRRKCRAVSPSFTLWHRNKSARKRMKLNSPKVVMCCERHKGRLLSQAIVIAIPSTYHIITMLVHSHGHFSAAHTLVHLTKNRPHHTKYLSFGWAFRKHTHSLACSLACSFTGNNNTFTKAYNCRLSFAFIHFHARYLLVLHLLNFHEHSKLYLNCRD